MSDMEWRAHISDEFDTFTERVVLHRRLGDLVEVVTGFDANGVPELTRYQPGVAPGDVGIRLPAGALRAIAEAVKPGPSTGELGVLREALELERERVDRALERS